MRLRKYFPRESDFLPGVSSFLQSPMPWNALFTGMEDILKQIYGHDMPTAFFIDKKADHRDGKRFVPVCSLFG